MNPGAAGSSNQSRHCAVCLIPLSAPRVCGGCRRRAYCGSACQARDWKVKGGGQSHKIWCPLRCGEEDLDWTVAPIKGKGLGLVALRHIPARTRILVDAARDDHDPVVLDLEPVGAPLAIKISLNQLGFATGQSVVCARVCRANHSCDPNADHLFDKTYGVQILFACRNIDPGDEICIAYRSFNDSGEARTPDQVRAVLRSHYGIVCAPTCLCYDEGFRRLCETAVQLEARAQELASQLRPVMALAAVKKLLGLYTQQWASPVSHQRTLQLAFQLAISSMKTLPKSAAFIAEAIEILSDLVAPGSTLLMELRGFARDPSSHPCFLLFHPAS